MLTDDGKHLYVSWDEYHMLIERLALKIDASGWQFDQILCLARGGMRPGDVLSRVFDKPLAIMATSSYRAEAGTIQGRLDLAKYITLPRGERIDILPLDADEIVACKPVYETFPGWTESTFGVTEWDKLPVNARRYLERVQAFIGAPIDMVSTGPDRVHTILLRHPYK